MHSMTIDQAREIERAFLAGDESAKCWEHWGREMAGAPAEEIMEAAMDAAQVVIDDAEGVAE